MFRSSLSSSALASTTAAEIDAVMESTSSELESLQLSKKAKLETKEDKSHKNTLGTNKYIITQSQLQNGAKFKELSSSANDNTSEERWAIHKIWAAPVSNPGQQNLPPTVTALQPRQAEKL